MQDKELYTRLKMVEFALLSCMPEEKFYMPDGYETAHNVGRWWEAILLLEDRIGTVIPPRLEKGMQLNLRTMMGNPFGLLNNSREVQGSSRLNWHNPREGLLALSALVEFRQSRWAAWCGSLLVDTLDRRFFENTLSDDDICETLNIPLNDDPMVTRTAEDPYPEEDYTGSTGPRDRRSSGVLSGDRQPPRTGGSEKSGGVPPGTHPLRRRFGARVAYRPGPCGA